MATSHSLSTSSNYSQRRRCHKLLGTNSFIFLVGYTDLDDVISVLGGNYGSFYLLHKFQMLQHHSEVRLVNLRLIGKDINAGLV